MAMTRSPTPKRDGLAPDGHHLAGELQSGDVGRGTRGGRVEAPALHEVGGVDAGGPHGHQQVAGTRIGIGVLLPVE